MKKQNLSFAAIVAFVAVVYTIAAQAMVFDVRPMRVVDCFRPPVDIKKSNCTGPVVTIEISSPCSALNVNDHIYSLSSVLIDPIISCNGGTFTCCFTIVNDSNPCMDQPSLDPPGSLPNGKYKVSQVFCKPIAN